ncbi:DNA mismatch repair protein [Sphingobacterium thalpophilum]|uniref:MutS-related protein n=1 Tax=Sphingobacterium thalpophilum TaxID=259 RepID=UPI0037DA39AA
MDLIIDAQTLQDLRIFGSGQGKGIFDRYNHCKTLGGEQLLTQLFQRPLRDMEVLQERIQLFSFFINNERPFPFEPQMIDAVERYFQYQPKNENGELSPRLSDKDVQQAVQTVIRFFLTARDFLKQDFVSKMPWFDQHIGPVNKILHDAVFAPVFREETRSKLPFTAITAYDRLFRSQENEKVQQLLQFVYKLDVWMAVAHAARAHGWTLPEILPRGSQQLEIRGLYHPELENPVKNDVHMNDPINMIFLTGANMAGKSTFLRALGIAVFLAHMGFPLAAKAMRISLMDAIFTTINLPDNIGIGASHFYAEVLRVKQLAERLQAGLHVYVIFDELFRGTNVKDAHEATVAVAQRLVKSQHARFVISSHIVEAAADMADLKAVDFAYLPTEMLGLQPKYSYKLSPGVTDDRHGMLIIRNEGILDILANGNKM